MRKQNEDICTYPRIFKCTSHTFAFRKFLIYFSKMSRKPREWKTWDTRKSEADPEAY